MKKVFYLILCTIATCSLLLSCEKEDGGTLKKSDIYGSWNRTGQTMTINRNGTYNIVGIYSSANSSGTWSFDGASRIWVQHRNDGKTYTNLILVLDKQTFSYTDQYGNNEVWTR